MKYRMFWPLGSAIVLGAVGMFWGGQTTTDGANGPAAEAEQMVQISQPVLDGPQKLGQTAFNAKCAACHGAGGAGVPEAGPPLIHKIYEPSHHGDRAFFLAARQGVRAHHWTMGNMPPVQGITDAEIATIIAYVRAIQRANGIL